MQGSRVHQHSKYRKVLPNYRLGKTLGMGSFAKVKLAVHNLSGVKVAIKIIDRLSLDKVEAAKVSREITMMKRLSHPHVVRLFEVIETASNIYMVMEYVSSGELFFHLIDKGKLDEDEARRFFQQIISGVEYCHHHKVAHRDLKPENLLLDSKGNIKIIDFGLGNVMHDGHLLKTNCGSSNYAAPEVIDHQLYPGPEVDVWSCGVILYALLCGRLPFDDDSFPRLYAKIRNGAYTVTSHMSQSAKDLITKILVVDPIKRITIPEIRRHPWFQVRLPKYIANPRFHTSYDSEKVNEDVMMELASIGFDTDDVVGSLCTHLENQATVTYHLLLHRHLRNSFPDDDSDLPGYSEMDYGETYSRPASTGQEKWTLGFKSQASPHETMTNVLKVFQGLNVQWKRIGNYNMKCRYEHPRSRCKRLQLLDAFPHTLLDATLPIIPATPEDIDAVKFELQLYKASGEMYLLDLQFLKGAPLMFLQLCATFLSAAGVM